LAFSHVQVSVEERENLTVTGNASITTRTFCVTLLAAILALVFVATMAEDADARRVRHRRGTAAFVDTFTPPDRFSCRFLSVGKPLNDKIAGYRCTAATTTFLLDDVLTLDGNPPPSPDLVGVAIPPPNLFQCDFDRNAAGDRSAEHFSCEYRQNQQTHVFKVNEIVSTNVDEDNDKGETIEENPDHLKDLFLPPGPNAVPTAVPAGADAAAEGSAAWLFGLVLAACGAVAGTVVIARRRFSA
jgi:hypothetical protein